MENTIERCAGITTGLGYVVGGGYYGKTEELDNIVTKEAEILQKLYGKNVVIRFNSDRMSGGAYIKDGKTDSSIGLGARAFNSKMIKMLKYNYEDFFNLSIAEQREMENNLDTIKYEVCIDTTLTDNTCLEGEFIFNHFFKDFSTLEEAVDYLKRNVKGLKDK